MIGVIVPFARPWMASNVLASYMRQTLCDTCLIVVENGPALNTWSGSVGDVVQSEHGRSHARTAGLHKARELGCEWYAYWDDDDWHAPGFLEFMWARRHLADVIGFVHHVAEDPTGKRWLMKYDEHEGLRAPRVPANMSTVVPPKLLAAAKAALPVGGIAPSTMFGNADMALDWTAHVAFSEEVFWMTDMHRAGRTLYGLAEPNPEDPLFVLKRYPDPNHGHALKDWRREFEGSTPV